MVTDTLPPPDGFLRGDGVPCLLTAAYAEVLPQHGLTPVIVLDRGFPIEEDLHLQSLMTNLPLTLYALKHDWNAQPTDPIPSWRPFIEAVSDVLIGIEPIDGITVDEALLEQHEAYATIAAGEILARNDADPDANTDTDPDPAPAAGSDAAGSSAQSPTDAEGQVDVADPQQDLAHKLARFIAAYLDQDLLATDLLHGDLLQPKLLSKNTDLVIDRAEQLVAELAASYSPDQFSEPEKVFFTTKLVELYLQTELAGPDGLAAVYNRGPTWQTISTTLDRWTAAATIGRSPFPITQIHPSEVIEMRAAIVTVELAALLGQIIFSQPSPEQYLVRSLPTLSHLLNPLHRSGVQPTALPPVTHPYLLLVEEDDCIAAHFLEPSTIPSVRDRIRSAWESPAPACSLYNADSESWIGPTQHRSVATYALATALQVWNCLRRLETLWHQREDPQTCHHCRLISSMFQAPEETTAEPAIRRVAPLLEQRAFTLAGLEPFLNAADLYPDWLRHKTIATVHHHPAFAVPSPE